MKVLTGRFPANRVRVDVVLGLLLRSAPGTKKETDDPGKNQALAIPTDTK